MKKFCTKTTWLAGLFLLSTACVGAAEIEFVTIGDAGNSDHTTGWGGVDYIYSIAKTEVTNAQYIEFLNAVAQTDTYGLYYSSMNSTYGGITRDGVAGSYSYSLKNDDQEWANRPVVWVDWYDTLRFVNWLNNGQLSGDQDDSTTESGAYKFVNGTLNRTYYDGELRNPDATYWLPSKDEWYKAAYYDPTKNGGTGGYWLYATQSDSDPVAGVDANYNSIGLPYYTSEVGTYDNDSYYGTYDQNGNVHEWLETPSSGYIYLHGAGWSNTGTNYLRATTSSVASAAHENYHIGFRIASSFAGTSAVPEPLSIGLLLCGIAGIIVRRIKRG